MLRPQAASYSSRLNGNVHLRVPRAWSISVYGLAIATCVASVVVISGTYSRVVTVTGQIEPDLGSAEVLPSRAGIITAISVKEGGFVKTGTHLATVQAEEVEGSGSTGPEQILLSLKDQDGRLAAQERSNLAEGLAARERMKEEQSGLRDEITSIDSQVRAQNQLIESAKEDLDRIQEVAKRGFISKRDLQSSQDMLISRRQQLDSLLQGRAEKRASLLASLHAAQESISQSKSIIAGIASGRATVAQQEYAVAASRGYVLTAPVPGTVAALTARVGQSAQASVPLMKIIPHNAHLEAWLYVPTQAVGFLRVGQPVRLQVNAFPYTRFGTISAVIKTISNAAIARSPNGNLSEPLYMVTASINNPGFSIAGSFYKLQPDMTLSARIITERHSLLEWLFEPVSAVGKR